VTDCINAAQLCPELEIYVNDIPGFDGGNYRNLRQLAEVVDGEVRRCMYLTTRCLESLLRMSDSHKSLIDVITGIKWVSVSVEV
jgi:hypothetical protein